MSYMKKWGTAVVGIGCFIGGTYCGRSKLFESTNVFASESVVPHVGDALPYEASFTKSRSDQIMKFGFPGLDNLKAKQDYVVSYDKRNRVANWVCEHLTRDSVRYNKNVDRSNSEFFEDETIHPYFRSRNTDYKRSGFDRGHLAAAGNHRNSQSSLDDTFALSNIAPQVGVGFNRDAWNKLEMYVRDMTKKYQNVYVCSGPLYLPRLENDGKKYVKYQVIGANNVAVPTHFYKVIVGETNNGLVDLETFVMPNAPINDNVPLQSFLVPRDSIERAAGLLFFDKIPPNVFRNINGMKARG